VRLVKRRAAKRRAWQMRRRWQFAFAVGVALAGPAAAQDSVGWGDGAQFTVELRHAEPHVADVVATNRLTRGHDRETGATLYLGELAVDVLVIHHPGILPDEVIVEVPEGYLAIPPVIMIEENAVGVIAIHRADEVPLG
jgi:hypothetical protein